MTNHSWFINCKTIFDQSSVSLAEKQTGDDWRIKDLFLNIVLQLIHGEPAFIAEYWRAITIANVYFGEIYIVTNTF